MSISRPVFRRRASFVALGLVFLVGCTVERHLPILEIHSAQLVTPTGRVPLEIATEAHSSIYRRNPLQRMVATHDGITVTLGVLPGVNSVSFHEPGRALDVAVVGGASSYRLNEGAPVPLQVVDRRPEVGAFQIRLPPGLSGLEMMMSGGSLLESTVRKIQAGREDLHQMHLAFLIDGEAVSTDLSFSVDVETKRFVASPATP